VHHAWERNCLSGGPESSDGGADRIRGIREGSTYVALVMARRLCGLPRFHSGCAPRRPRRPYHAAPCFQQSLPAPSSASLKTTRYARGEDYGPMRSRFDVPALHRRT
jgi:hypothetical protein